VAFVYHGTPMTPKAAFKAVMPARGVCISYGTPTDDQRALEHCPFRMYDNGEFKAWNKAKKDGLEWDEAPRDHTKLYAWYEQRIFQPGCWGVIPDRPGAPTQFNDGLLNDWPFGRSVGAPLFHMNGSTDRLLKLCDRFDRVCLGWVGGFDEVAKRIKPEEEDVGCPAYRAKMDEIAKALGNRWPPIHMLRGILVGGDYPFLSVDATSLAQNGHRHDWRDHQACMFEGYGPGKWNGRKWYADNLEAMAA